MTESSPATSEPKHLQPLLFILFFSMVNFTVVHLPAHSDKTRPCLFPCQYSLLSHSGEDVGISFHSCSHHTCSVCTWFRDIKRVRCGYGVLVASHIYIFCPSRRQRNLELNLQSLFMILVLMTDYIIQIYQTGKTTNCELSPSTINWSCLLFSAKYCRRKNTKEKAADSADVLQRCYCSGTSFCFIFGCSLNSSFCTSDYATQKK